MTEKEVMNETIIHMCEYHAIDPEEMNTCMRLKIRKNIHLVSLDPLLRRRFFVKLHPSDSPILDSRILIE